MKHKAPSLKPELGQVLTPPTVAFHMVNHSLKLAPSNPVILDPAVGPATFPVAFARAGVNDQSATFHLFDIDSRMVAHTRRVVSEHGLKARLYETDYLTYDSRPLKPDIIIMNPPYIRHELIPAQQKLQYCTVLQQQFGQAFSRQSNLYVYFLLKAIADLPPGGVLAAIVYDGLTSTRYGEAAFRVLNRYLDLAVSERVQQPFANVLIDGIILVGRKRKQPVEPSQNRQPPQKPADGPRCSLGNLLTVRRGLGLLNSRLFMADPSDDYYELSKPFLKKHSHPVGLAIKDVRERAFIFGPSEDVEAPLVEALTKRAWQMIHNPSVPATRNLVATIERNPNGWFRHVSVVGTLLFNYYIRGEPRHLLNEQRFPAADNFFVSNPIGIPARSAWLLLNSRIYRAALLEVARNQGSGLTKLQLYEYKSAWVPDWRTFDSRLLTLLNQTGQELGLGNEADFRNAIARVDKELKARGYQE